MDAMRAAVPIIVNEKRALNMRQTAMPVDVAQYVALHVVRIVCETAQARRTKATAQMTKTVEFVISERRGERP
jgi:hypothetical protein